MTDTEKNNNNDKQSSSTTTGSGASSSYTYWVREATQDAAPLPAPRKLSAQDISSTITHSTSLGFVWNRVCFVVVIVVLRWINYLRPDLKRGNFTGKKDELIIKLFAWK